MGKTKNLKHGEARLEFVACRAQVEEMLAQGHSISSIHGILTKNGIITMSYKTLQDKIRKIAKAPRSTGIASAPAKPPVVEQPMPVQEVMSTVQLKDLDEALEEAAALREKSPKQSGKEGQGYSRKKVIG